MDTILIAVTSLSLAAAAGMGAMLARTLRIERRRSDARVVLLEELASSRSSLSTPQPPRRPATLLDDFELRPSAARVDGASSIFEHHEEPSAWPRRFAVIGVMAIVVSGVFLGLRALGTLDGGSNSAPASTRATAEASAPVASGPLELLSLQHAEENGSLVISGMVQNPRAGTALSGVQATVVLLAADGRTLASNRAPL